MKTMMQDAVDALRKFNGETIDGFTYVQHTYIPSEEEINTAIAGLKALEKVREDLSDVIDKCDWDVDADPYNSGALYGMKYALGEINRYLQESKK